MSRLNATDYAFPARYTVLKGLILRSGKENARQLLPAANHALCGLRYYWKNHKRLLSLEVCLFDLSERSDITVWD